VTKKLGRYDVPVFRLGRLVSLAPYTGGFGADLLLAAETETIACPLGKSEEFRPCYRRQEYDRAAAWSCNASVLSLVSCGRLAEIDPAAAILSRLAALATTEVII